jgi:hypothetical protein
MTSLKGPIGLWICTWIALVLLLGPLLAHAQEGGEKAAKGQGGGSGGNGGKKPQKKIKIWIIIVIASASLYLWLHDSITLPHLSTRFPHRIFR